MDPTLEDLEIRRIVLKNLYAAEDISQEALWKGLAVIACEFMRLDSEKQAIDIIRKLGYSGYFGDISLRHRREDPEFDARLRYLDSEIAKRNLWDKIDPDLRPTQPPAEA